MNRVAQEAASRVEVHCARDSNSRNADNERTRATSDAKTVTTDLAVEVRGTATSVHRRRDDMGEPTNAKGHFVLDGVRVGCGYLVGRKN